MRKIFGFDSEFLAVPQLLKFLYLMITEVVNDVSSWPVSYRGSCFLMNYFTVLCISQGVFSLQYQSLFAPQH